MNDETVVRELDAQRRKAMIDADLATLEPLIDDDVLWIHGSARVDDKAAFLHGIATGAADYRTIEVSQEKYRQLGPGAMLATCITHMDVSLDGKPRDITVRNVLVWHRPENPDGPRAGWRLVSYQSTPVTVA